MSIASAPGASEGIAGAALASVNPALNSMASAIGAIDGCMAIWFAALVALNMPSTLLFTAVVSARRV